LRSLNIKYLWADLIIEELTRCGVSEFCISSGSRNSPLVLAAAANSKAETVVHLDERGVAFYAIGCAKANGQPAALICTSGTAVANYLPAVIEASTSSVPLIILSADRPVELRDTGANQTVDQVGIYGKYTRWSFDLPSPSCEVPAEFVLTTVDQLAYRAKRVPSGPVQLNCMFTEPLTPEADNSIIPGYQERIGGWNEADTPYTDYVPSLFMPVDSSLNGVRAALMRSRRGVIVCGGLDCFSNNNTISKLAENLRMPLLADISSGLRFGNPSSDNLVTHYDLFLRDALFTENHRPDLILHFGGPVVSKELNGYLEGSRAEHIVVNRTPFRQDPGHSVRLRVEMEPGQFCETMADFEMSDDSDLLTVFGKADAICSDHLSKLEPVNDLTNEFAAVYQTLGLLPDDSGLFLANSMPVRDADGCGITGPQSIHVGVNRGASGIDGNIATAVGFANGLGKRTTLLIGDLAFVHDVNSLLLARNSPIPVTIVLLNNDGGGIFSFLPIAECGSRFEEFFGTPHGLDFKHAVSLFELEYFRAETVAQLRDYSARAFEMPRSSVIEIRTERAHNLAQHQRIWKSVMETIREHSA
jgi:2-succinyl-5-enolpyruvyl-6-hydroxy-3-cyclohexene-1-carboxylate synthase